jgi:hypothetical protein
VKHHPPSAASHGPGCLPCSTQPIGAARQGKDRQSRNLTPLASPGPFPGSEPSSTKERVKEDVGTRTAQGPVDEGRTAAFTAPPGGRRATSHSEEVVAGRASGELVEYTTSPSPSVRW